MTRLVCMYGGDYPKPATLDPRAKNALERFAPAAGLEIEWVNTAPNRQVYADEMEKRWGGSEDLIIVEQDKEIHASCLPEFLSCPALWCGYTYWINPEPHTALVIGGFGVVKFSAAVQRMIPVDEFRGETQVNIDRRFDLALLKRGHRCCLHGHVVHHHVYEPRPKIVREYVSSMRAQGIMAPSPAPSAPEPGLLPGSYRL